MNTSRNLWPLGVVATLAIFLIGTIGLIVMACSQKVDLVSADYYEKEIKFQGQIDRAERTRRLANQASITYDAAGKCITIALPPEQAGQQVTGSVELYRPSAADMDRAIKLAPDAKGLQRIDAVDLAKGQWRVRLSWTAEAENYYLEKQVVVGSGTS